MSVERCPRRSCVGVLIAALVGCAGPPSDNWNASEAPPPAPAATADPAAASLFQSRCAPCHGAAGHGDGPAATSLNPHPRDLSDGAWQASVQDAYIERVIREGGGAVGRSALMPANADLDANPVGISGLRAYVRSLRVQ